LCGVADDGAYGGKSIVGRRSVSRVVGKALIGKQNARINTSLKNVVLEWSNRNLSFSLMKTDFVSALMGVL